MSQFAANTSVSMERSRAEIEQTLTRYGATSFMYGWNEARGAVVMFELQGRRIKFLLPVPDRKDRRFTHTPTGKVRVEAQEWEQAQRQGWRALNLVIKAKLEAVESGITTFEDEFLSNIMLPDGSTVGDFMAPQLAIAYEPASRCELCGKIAELRPYGPNGEKICYECGKKNPEMTERRMGQHLFGVGFDA